MDRFGQDRKRKDSPLSVKMNSLLEGDLHSEEIGKLLQELDRLKKGIEDERQKRILLESEMQRMATKVIEVQEEERKRISRNLHDGLGQNLYSHLITINLIKGEVTHPLMKQIEREASQLIEDVREIAWELRPAVLDDLGLIPAIRSFIARYTDFSNIKVHFEVHIQRRFPINIDLTIYRIIQEALTNIRKYAEVEEAWISIIESDHYIKVDIVDDGKGFDSNHVSKGVGISSMEERARAVGGIFQLHSNPGHGTKISIDIPK